jgi:hypothetical protein
MLTNLFGRGTKKTVHCEINGKETSIDMTRVLTKISGVINLKMFDNPRVDNNQKVIHSDSKPPIKFYTKVYNPQELNGVLGELYATVEDEDEVEQSTHILSDEGINYFMGNQLIKLIDYLKQYELIKFPDTMFFVSANDTSNFKMQNKTCASWGIEYPSLGKKYMVKKILESKTDKQTFGYMNVLLPPFDLAVSDCAAKNPNGTGYLFRTERHFTPVNLCSNESAVDYCNKNNCLAYYTDFMNGGKMRVLTKYTESINKNLQNNYRFRSSNI